MLVFGCACGHNWVCVSKRCWVNRRVLQVHFLYQEIAVRVVVGRSWRRSLWYSSPWDSGQGERVIDRFVLVFKAHAVEGAVLDATVSWEWCYCWGGCIKLAGLISCLRWCRGGECATFLGEGLEEGGYLI